MIYKNRVDAGEKLAEALYEKFKDAKPIVLALPRGGVPVAGPVAKRLNAPLDVFQVRKLGVPGHEEYAMGAIATGGVRVLNENVIRQMMVTENDILRVARQEEDEMRRRERAYRGSRPFPDLEGKTVIIVDDGLATGATLRAAVLGVKEYMPARVVAAAPVGSIEACTELRETADEVICLETPARFGGVGAWYDDFSQTTDEEVRSWLGVE
ncbi:phosphoribosyltransferase [Oceanidesulfovibrio indonesiensis]|uniref:Phosphoribosyltransferase n=1 Tax=Oceanidesulfovibrio indonesiensis TaxID=54767 RepID=A0A7M3MCT3_9BACT|nr:phosphoribosyltransferase family protein [Oceanidesulfovibrio indonesiensis]TVM16275.1 phosphoribosyltransferase [Oceanidesulfovibrio indonesiensis]